MKTILLSLLLSTSVFAQNAPTKFDDDGLSCYDFKHEKVNKVLGSGIRHGDETLQFACMGSWKLDAARNVGVFTRSDECQIVCPIVVDREGIFFMNMALRLSREPISSDHEAAVLLQKLVRRALKTYHGLPMQDAANTYYRYGSLRHIYKRSKFLVASTVNTQDWNWSNQGIKVSHRQFEYFRDFVSWQLGHWVEAGWRSEGSVWELRDVPNVKLEISGQN